MATRKTKKSAPKKTSRTSTTSQNSRSFAVKSSLSKIHLKDLLLPLIVIVVIVFLGVFKNQFVVAEVNGQPITRLQLINQLEKKDGKSILESIITEQLILQEAKKKNVQVSDKEVSDEVSKIEKTITAQGQNIDSLLAQQGMTRSDLSQQVKIQLLLKKMVGGTEKVTDKEIDDYITQNQEAMPTDVNPDTLRSQVKQQLEQQKINEKIQTFVANLQKNAKIQYLKNF